MGDDRGWFEVEFAPPQYLYGVEEGDVPRVGAKQYAYDKAGRAAAKQEAARTGKPLEEAPPGKGKQGLPPAFLKKRGKGK